MKNRVKEERELQGISQKDLSEKADVSRTIISELETGKTETITNNTLEKIANALGKKVPDIFLLIKHNMMYKKRLRVAN